MKKRKTFYTLHKLKKEILSYGYEYNSMKYKIFLLLGILFCLFVTYLFQLSWTGMIIVLVSMILLSPHFVLIYYQELFEKKRFHDAVSYMSQMVYAFRRTPNIFNALTEVLKLCEDESKQIIYEAIESIENGNYEDNSSQIAFARIEQKYGNKRMAALHKYMLEVERRGGEYDHGLMILLEDIELWTEETCIMQQERKNMGTKLSIGFLISLVIAAFMVCLLPKDFGNMTESVLYQVVTTIILELFLVLYFVTRKMLQGVWLEKECYMSETTIDLYWKRIMDEYVKTSKKNRWAIIGIVGIVVVTSVLLNQIIITVIGMIFIIITFTMPERNYRYAKKRLEREVEKTFPFWLSELMLSLQVETLYNALESTTEKCPYVFKKELIQLVERISDTPNSLEPYGMFLDKLDIPEIKSIVMSLYSVVEYGTDEIQRHINEMVNRNNKLLRKAEKIANEDAIAGLNIMSLVPMGMSTLKIMFDLFLFLNSIMSGLSLFNLSK